MRSRSTLIIIAGFIICFSLFCCKKNEKPVYVNLANQANTITAANLSNDLVNWALKFEKNVPGDWNDPTLTIKCDVAGAICRYETWNSLEEFKTKGWVTATIPLSSFRTKSTALDKGRGTPTTTLTTLVGTSGSTGLFLCTYNLGASATETGDYAGFDNIRVVKTK